MSLSIYVLIVLQIKVRREMNVRPSFPTAQSDISESPGLFNQQA